MPDTILEVKNLKKHFPVMRGAIYERVVGQVKAVDGVDFVINRSETFSLVGESGCGKTTTGMVILRLLEPTSGSICFAGTDIAGLKRGQLKDYRRSVQAMFQDPWGSLNPRTRVKSILAEPLIVNKVVSKGEIHDRLTEAIVQVGLDRRALNLYPHEFSGGQRQRIALARAIIMRPQLVVLDEPVSALDVSIRAQIMNDLKDIQQQSGVAFLLIAHGLDTVRYMSHWIGVMYVGKIVEMGKTEELFTHPTHPYTQALFSAALPSHPDSQKQEIVLCGEVPNPINLPAGCRFHPRCFAARADCSKQEPQLIQVSTDHFVACHVGR